MVYLRAILFLRSIILPEVGNFVKNGTHDISQKIHLRESLKKNVLSSARNIGLRIVRGGGKRKIKSLQKQKCNKEPITNKKKKSYCGMKHEDVIASGVYGT